MPQEDRNAYVSITYGYVTKYGRPVRIQTDRHAAVWSEGGPTDYGKALGDLNIIHSIAYSPQSKGRVERVNRTLQDRLVKAMRLQGISSIKKANEYAPEFIKVFNQRFAKQAIDLTDHHRRLLREEDLNSAFAVKHIRRLTKNLSFSFKGQQYVIENGQGNRDVIGKKIVIEIQHGGNMLVRGAKGPVAVRPVE